MCEQQSATRQMRPRQAIFQGLLRYSPAWMYLAIELDLLACKSGHVQQHDFQSHNHPAAAGTTWPAGALHSRLATSWQLPQRCEGQPCRVSHSVSPVYSLLLAASWHRQKSLTSYESNRAVSNAVSRALQGTAAQVSSRTLLVPLTALSSAYRSPFQIETADPQRDLVDPAVVGTRNVLSAVKVAKTVRRVILTSSVAGVGADLHCGSASAG